MTTGGTVEVRIGIIQSPREISFETDAAAEEVRASVESALSEGKQPLISFNDNKGKQYLVPTSAIAYVELGGDAGRKIGFVNVFCRAICWFLDISCGRSDRTRCTATSRCEVCGNISKSRAFRTP